MIDWKFIASLEGGDILRAYVPMSGESGVTLAAGVDLGQFAESELTKLTPNLASLVRPYIGLKLDDARAALTQAPLTITADEATALDEVARTADLVPIANEYMKSTKRAFSSCTDSVQTVVASVGFQYGNEWSRCPKFWAAVVANNINDMIFQLNNFGDSYPTRRKREAAYLQEHALTV